MATPKETAHAILRGIDLAHSGEPDADRIAVKRTLHDQLDRYFLALADQGGIYHDDALILQEMVEAFAADLVTDREE